MNNAENQKNVVNELMRTFKDDLKRVICAIGSIEEKEPLELVAWSRALLLLEQECREALLKSYDRLDDSNSSSQDEAVLEDLLEPPQLN